MVIALRLLLTHRAAQLFCPPTFTLSDQHAERVCSMCALPQGFNIPGVACSSLPTTPSGRGKLQFMNNAAHSNLVGLVLRAASDGGPCTALANFTTWLNWDFGIITLKGIPTDVTLQHVVVAGM